MIKCLLVRVIIIAFMLGVIISSTVYAKVDDGGADGAGIVNNGIDMEFPETNQNLGYINYQARKVWGTVVSIVQILAFAAVIFAGLRYMFSSADQKADIKRSLGILALGAILVFAASTVVKFVVGAAKEVI